MLYTKMMWCVCKSPDVGFGPGRGGAVARRQSGMTLVEVMVALLLVAFGLASGLSAFMAASRTAGAAERRAGAVHQARAVMEDLRSRSYNAIPSGTHTYSTGIRYVATLSSDFPATKDIRVTVDWINPNQEQPAQVTVWSSIASCIHP